MAFSVNIWIMLLVSKYFANRHKLSDCMYEIYLEELKMDTNIVDFVDVQGNETTSITCWCQFLIILRFIMDYNTLERSLLFYLKKFTRIVQNNPQSCYAQSKLRARIHTMNTKQSYEHHSYDEWVVFIAWGRMSNTIIVIITGLIWR